MRAGQHGTLTRVWGATGKRALAPKQMEYGNLHMFGAVCPGDGRALGMLSTHVDTPTMQTYLNEFSGQLPADEHAVMCVDQASYHTTPKLVMPPNVTLLFLPPCSPELNPEELMWREMRMKDLANRIFKTVQDVEEALIASWNKLISCAERVRSLCGFPWILGAGST
jgi:hypothetical protein